MCAPWEAEFEQLLRADLDGLRAAALDPDLPLNHYGLTSLGSLQLGHAISRRYGIPLPSFDERSFRTARSMWEFVAQRRADAPLRAGHPPAIAAPARCLAHRFADSSRRYADAVCVADVDGTVTYAQLADQAAALASVIGTGGVVAVLGERRMPTYRAYLAALYAGATVVPLSLDFPPERNAKIIRQSGARCLVLTDRRGDPLVEQQLEAIGAVGLVDGLDIPSPLAAHPTAHVSPDAVAYLIFTSGSTGLPKGVALTHRNVDAFLGGALPNLSVGPGDVFSQAHGLTFDFSVFEMWGAWSTGATLAAVSRIEALSPADTAARRGVTVWSGTPSLIETAATAGLLAAGSMPGVRYLVLGGEPLSQSTMRLARAAAPNAIIDNVYGPTETTVWTTTYRMPPDGPEPSGRIVPLGTPLPSVDVRVSGAGELLIAGAQVFPGYVDPSLDAEKFVHADGRRWYRTGDIVDRDESGLLRYRGRMDGQVKVRGYRIELGEIEQTAAQLLGGARTAAVPTAEGAQSQLVLFVEAASVDEPGLRHQLGRLLPGYMVPSRVIAVDSFRLTAHAKLDRAHLADLVPGPVGSVVGAAAGGEA